MTNFIEDKLWKEYMESDEYREELRKNNSSIKMHQRKILSANEAREKLNKVLENDEKELEEIMGKIEVAINRKLDYIFISSTTQKHTLQKLAQLGYHIGDIIKGDRPFDPDTIKISW